MILCYPKCTTCQKAKKWLAANDVVLKKEHKETILQSRN